MAEMLREDGFTVELYSSAAPALDRLTRDPLPFAVLVELTMSSTDGVAIARLARERQPSMPLLILTSYPNLFYGNSLDGPEATLFVKPVDYAALSNTLRRASARASGEGP